MLIKKISKSGLKMLIALILTLALISGIYFAIPKQSKTVSAATTGSSAILKGYTGYNSMGGQIGTPWHQKLKSPVSEKNVTSITITTNSSKLTGFTKGENVADESSPNELYYYYKLAGYQVDANNDNLIDSDGYDIIIYANVETIFAPEYSVKLFLDFRNCKSIDFDNFDTRNVTDMSMMFLGCSSLTSLNLSKIDTSKVTTMQEMFRGCSSLTSLNLSNFNTSHVTNMYAMFSDCSSLTSLNVSSFNTSKVTNMETMFCDCFSLTTLNLSNFKTSNVTNMNDMFSQCKMLSSLDLSGFDTSKVTTMENMFFGCLGLKKLDISNFSFESISDSSGVQNILGVSYAQVAQMYGLDVATFVNASFETKVMIALNKVGSMYSEEYIRVTLKHCGAIPCIVAPSNLNGLIITIPGEYNYTNGGEAVTSVLLAGKTHTLVGVSIDTDDTVDTSIDTNDTGAFFAGILLSVIVLCFVYSCFMIFRKKKKR